MKTQTHALHTHTHERSKVWKDSSCTFDEVKYMYRREHSVAMTFLKIENALAVGLQRNADFDFHKLSFFTGK